MLISAAGRTPTGHIAIESIREDIMDAQIFQIDKQRSKRAAQLPAFPIPMDLMAATRSATEFFVWYAGAMLTIHVAIVRSACESMVRHG